MAQSSSRLSRLATHPITLAVTPILLGAIGWLAVRYVIERDRTALRLEAQGIAQAVALVQTSQPTIDGEVMFCDTAKLTLLLAHNQDGKRPIVVNTIALHIEPIIAQAPAASLACEVDPLQTRPFGIVLRNTYLFDATGLKLAGRFIESGQPGAAQSVNSSNILQVGSKNQSVLLKPEEEPVAWDVIVAEKTSGLYRLWFTAQYDAGGQRQTETHKFILGK